MYIVPPLVTRYAVHGRLAVEAHANREALGLAAARAAAASICGAIAAHGGARVVFACAPSQDEFLAALADPSQTGILVDWSKVTAFHMDDYVGLSASHPRSFRSYLRERLLDRVAMGRFHPIEAERRGVEVMCDQYAALLSEKPIELICLGIGENGHIAFNDPGEADFEDPRLVGQVRLDLKCRQQQVNDGCFPAIEDVPPAAVSLTVPVFRRARQLSIHVPGSRKAGAVLAALTGPIGPEFPASILRLHHNATLYLDADSSASLGS
ncbi:MAG: 6-phosphogluconolactonase [Opitutaceae bacterium]